MGATDDMVLPDALATELMARRFRVIERSALRQIVSERGMDLTEILNGEEYFTLGTVADVSTVVIVNPTMVGPAVANASVRVVDVASGDLLLSTTYTQPRADNPRYARHDTILETAAKLAAPIASLLRD
jgi:curli biogenesis system outer membrane secretion channel CsgG